MLPPVPWIMRGENALLSLGTIILVAILMLAIAGAANARDGASKFAGSALKAWFDKLASGKGLCCSFADGVSMQDVDWDTKGGHYRVRLCPRHPGPTVEWPMDCPVKAWVTVPDAAVVTEPNRFGPSVVWPYQDSNGNTQIRCFLPSAMS